MILSYRSQLSVLFFFSSRRRHTRLQGDWSSDVCSSDLRRLGSVFDSDHDPADCPWHARYGGLWCYPPALCACPPAVQIGRASCRERVEVWGGAGARGRRTRRRRVSSSRTRGSAVASAV